MPKEKLREPMPRAQEVRFDVLATPQQIARRFLLLGGNMDRRERARPKQNGELPCVAAVGLNPVAGAARNERGRDHVTRNLSRRQRRLQVTTAAAAS